MTDGAVSERSIVRTYLAVTTLTTLAQSLIWGVNTLFLMHAGLDILGVMVANAAFTVAQVLFEIPTGVVADTWGRRISYLLSVSIIMVATILYMWVGASRGGILAFCLASVLLGIGFTFYTGAVDAWMVDALRATGSTLRTETVFARAGVVFGISMVIGTTVGGALGQAGLWLPYVGRTVLLVPALILGIVSMPRPWVRAQAAAVVQCRGGSAQGCCCGPLLRPAQSSRPVTHAGWLRTRPVWHVRVLLVAAVLP